VQKQPKELAQSILAEKDISFSLSKTRLRFENWK